MLPKLVVLAKRDLAKILGDEQKYKELSKITQINADDICRKTMAVAQSPVKIINKIRRIHSDTFPIQIIQSGILGKEVIRNHNVRQKRQKKSRKGRRAKKTSRW